MSNVGYDTWFTKRPSTKFVVKNIAPNGKRVRIFAYPINNGFTRDLLSIPGVSEADIRHSLLKGELMIKIQNKELIVTDSDIDLLQFNDDQKLFLQDAGIIKGLQVSSSNLDTIRQEDIELIGTIDNINTVFTIPSGFFIQNSTYKIIVYKNGVKQVFLDDYFIAESGGPGTGYDTVIFLVAPTTVPSPIDVVTADYYINNT